MSEEEQLAQLDQLIEIAKKKEESQNEEFLKIHQLIVGNLNNLQLLIKYLSLDKDITAITYDFSFISQLLLKRGSVLNPSDLTEIIQILIHDVISKKSHFLTQNQSAPQFCAKVIGILYRYLFCQQQILTESRMQADASVEDQFELIFTLLQGDNSLQALAIVMMSQIIEWMKKPIKFISQTNQAIISASFTRLYLFRFFEAGAHIVLRNRDFTHPGFKEALKLMLSTLQFKIPQQLEGDMPDSILNPLDYISFYLGLDEPSTYTFPYYLPPDWAHFYATTEIAETLIFIYSQKVNQFFTDLSQNNNNPSSWDIISLVLDVLNFYIMVKEPRHFEVVICVVDKISAIIQELLQFLTQNPISAFNINPLTAFSIKLFSLINNLSCLDRPDVSIQDLFTKFSDIYFQFLDCTFELSRTFFQFQELHPMILKFWAKISNGISRLSKSRRAVDQLPMNLPPDRIIEMLKNMFEVCIGTFLSQQENTNITASHILGLDQINEEGMNIDLFIQMQLIDKCSIFVSEHLAFWSIISPLPDELSFQLCSHVAELLNTNTQLLLQGDNTLLALQNISILILLITAKLDPKNLPIRSNTNNPINQRKMLPFLLAIIQTILATSDKMGQILESVQGNIYVSFFEATILHFCNIFILHSHFKIKDVNISENLLYDSFPNLNNHQDLFNVVVNRFLMDLNIFINSDLLLNILKFLSDASKITTPTEIAQYAASNELLQALIHRQHFLQFEGAPIGTLKKVIPLLNSIYARNISDEDWKVFLSYFDEKMEHLSSPEDVFRLFREITGVLQGINRPVPFLAVVRWFLGKHISHLLECLNQLKTYNDPKETYLVLFSVIKAWYLIFSNKGKKLILPSGSAEGIQIFKITLQVLQIIIDIKLPHETILQLALKLVCPCFTETYANFGIMQYYNDPDFDNMMSFVSLLVKEMAHGELQGDLKSTRRMLKTLVEISKTVPEQLFAGEILGDTITFLFQVLDPSPPNESHERLNYNSNLPDNDPWKLSCDALDGMMKFAIGNEDLGNVWTSFEPIFIVLLEGICVSMNPTWDAAASPLYYIIALHNEFASSVMVSICNLFEGNIKAEVEEKIRAIFSKVDGPYSTESLMKFRTALNNFKVNISRYGIRLSEIPEYRPLFQHVE